MVKRKQDKIIAYKYTMGGTVQTIGKNPNKIQIAFMKKLRAVYPSITAS
jgi:hypothetical protein